MGKGRLEAFSDGVIAIIITIMVLELKVPHSAELSALWELGPVFLSYVLSFAYVGIYWNNHHHLFHAVKHVSGGLLWANLHLLFWLSLFPFTTGWMGENHFATWPVVIYGVNLMLAAFAYTILVRIIIRVEGKDSVVARPLARISRATFRWQPMSLQSCWHSTTHGFPARFSLPWPCSGSFRIAASRK